MSGRDSLSEWQGGSNFLQVWDIPTFWARDLFQVDVAATSGEVVPERTSSDTVSLFSVIAAHHTGSNFDPE